MALQEQKGSNSLERYIAEVRSVWGEGKDPQLPFKVKALMEKLFTSTSPDDAWMAELIRDGKPSRELYRDPDFGFIQMGHVHKQRHGNLPHDHGPCWVVYGATPASPRSPNTNVLMTAQSRESRLWKKKGSIGFPLAWFSRTCREISIRPTPLKVPQWCFAF